MNALAETAAFDRPDIDSLVAHLSDLRALSQQRRYRGPAPKLPSRKTVIAAIDDLVSALYPRHFGPQGLGGGVWLTHSVPAGSHVTQAKPRQESFDDGAGI